MKLQRYYLECLSHASYLVADSKTGEAAIIDPQRDIDAYVQDAKAQGLTIKHVILTHFHADFVSGHIELRDRVGATIYLGARAEAEFDFQRLADGDTIEMGDVQLQALETPGHTPEGLTILAIDVAQDAHQPVAAFTGDTLFIGDVGRPDLLASVGVTADQLANMLYDSLHNKLLPLPDETLVYPAHGAGSMCGKSLSNEAVSTMGEQRRYNYALQPMSRSDFVNLVTADQPTAPAYFGHDATLNRQERPSLGASLRGALQPLELEKVLELQKNGAQLVDTRHAVSFAGAHLRGTWNIPIEGKFATWAGTMLDPNAPIVVIADEAHLEESVVRLGRIGFDHVAGYLADGLAALQDRPELLQQTLRMSAAAVSELADEKTIIDVRSEREWQEGHIANSRNIPLPQLQARLNEIPDSAHTIVHCAGGYRSTIATSLLQRAEHPGVIDLIGGYQAWVRSGLPYEESLTTSP